jgi:TPR repeat protein
MSLFRLSFVELFAKASYDDQVGLYIGSFYDELVIRLVRGQLSINDIEVMLVEAESQVNKEQDVLRFSNLVTMRGAFYQAKIKFAKSFTGMKEEDYRLAIECYEKAMDLGNVTAISYRAYLHKHGLGGAVNSSAAIELFEKAIALGNVLAMYNRACMHEDGLGGSINYLAAIGLYEQAIKLGCEGAMNNRALMYRKGLGGSINYPAAIALYEQAIVLGNAAAMNNRAYLHSNGLGGSVNYPAAIALYKRAMDLGNKHAMNNLAFLYQNNSEGKPNYPAAIALYDKAIALDHKYAMYNRAFMHFHGQGGSINYAAGLSLIRQFRKLTAKAKNAQKFERLHQGIPSLLSIVQSLNIEQQDIYIQYQWLMAQYEAAKIDFRQLLKFFRAQPAALIKFIAADAVLSETEKNNHISLIVNFCVKHHMSIKQEVERDKDALNKKAAFETIGNYFIAQVDKAMAENPVNPNKLLAYLAEVPSVSSAYRSALQQETDLLNSLVRDRELPLAEKCEIYLRIEYAHQEILHIDASLLRDKVQGLDAQILELEKNKGSKPEIQALKRCVKEVQEKAKMIESLLQGHEDTGLLKSLNWQEMENKNVLLYLQRKIDYAEIRRTWKEECIEKLKQQLWLAEREKNNFTSQYKLFSNKLSVIVKAQAIQKLLNLIQANNSQEGFLPQELATLKTYTLSKIIAEYKVLFPEVMHAENKTIHKKIINF